MTPRERMRNAASHLPVDRPPLDLGSTVNSSITKPAYKKLCAHLGLDEYAETELISKAMQVVIPAEEVLKRLNIDTRPVYCNPPDHDETKIVSEDEFIDEWGIRFKAAYRNDELLYFDVVDSPLADASTAQDIETHDWPAPEDPGRFRRLREKAKRLYEETDFAVVGHMGDTSIYQLCWDLRGMEQFFMDMLIDKAIAKALLEKVYQIQARKMEQYLQEVGDYLDVVCVGDELAGQTGPLTSLELYREMVLPYHSAYFSLIKSKTRAKLHLHTCGAVQEFIDDLADIGVDIVNPMQVSAQGMDPGYLKRTFGDKICFWGGIDTQRLLPNGTSKEVAENVVAMWNIMKENGGYILGAVHNIQDGVPPENIVAMFDTAAGLGSWNPP